MDLPVVDLAPFLQAAAGDAAAAPAEALRALCATVSASLRDTGALLVKDPRCTAADNDRFLDVVERYFARSDDSKRLQERPHLHYQVGVTPEGVEVPRSLVDKEMQDRIKSMPEEFQPATPKGPDPKWRYMWRVGPRPSNTRFKELNAEPVIPDGLPEWKETMDSWGAKMISAIEVVAEMAAIGFGLSKDAFTSLMKEGPHLLAPTGSNLLRHGSEGTVFAGFHYDLNFLTIHGRSRFPGLNIWLSNGKKMEVKVPVGCLLIQSGKQGIIPTEFGCPNWEDLCKAYGFQEGMEITFDLPPEVNMPGNIDIWVVVDMLPVLPPSYFVSSNELRKLIGTTHYTCGSHLTWKEKDVLLYYLVGVLVSRDNFPYNLGIGQNYTCYMPLVHRLRPDDIRRNILELPHDIVPLLMHPEGHMKIKSPLRAEFDAPYSSNRKSK